jgi:uncharacterized protein
MAEQPKPKIEFPCAYPIRVLGRHAEDFTAMVVTIVRRHAPDLPDEHVSVRPSSGGNYVSVQVVITATGSAQLQALFEDLKASGRVELVL